MQKVSANWTDAHKRTLLNESFVEVTLEITDPDALADATSQDNGAIYISDSSLLTNGDYEPTPYCTLEQNLWCLDGNRKAIPESDYGNNCFVSDAMSDDTCLFSAKLPCITIGFTKEFTKLLPGVTITWSETYGEFADTFSVVAYKGDTVVAETEVTGNRSVRSLVFVEISGYDRIEVIVKRWCLPNHRARVEDIFIGAQKIYGKSSLFSYSHTQSVMPVSLELPKNEIKFSIDNSDGEYNPQNTGGIAKYLNERQEVKARYGLKMDDGSVEWIKGGTFYLSEWYAKQNGITADFTARDMLEFMSDTFYDTEFEADKAGVLSNGRTFGHLAELVLTSANLPGHTEETPKWVIHESLFAADCISKAPLPKDTHANCLQLIANAAMCALYQDRDGVLHIEPFSFNNNPTIPFEPNYFITPFNSYTKAELTLAKSNKMIGVKSYTYTLGGDGSVNEDSHTHYHVHSSVGETIVVDNPLVTDGKRAQDIEWWLYNYYFRWRKSIDTSWRGDVRLDALDFVAHENAYSTDRVLMTEVAYTYNGAFRATGKGKVIADG